VVPHNQEQRDTRGAAVVALNLKHTWDGDRCLPVFAYVQLVAANTRHWCLFKLLEPKARTYVEVHHDCQPKESAFDTECKIMISPKAKTLLAVSSMRERKRRSTQEQKQTMKIEQDFLFVPRAIWRREKTLRSGCSSNR
jgi:hypothetical protein